jgi:hypothetical protein
MNSSQSITDKLKTLKSELELAQQILEDTPEWKNLMEIQKNIAGFQAGFFEQTKSEILAAGFEVRLHTRIDFNGDLDNSIQAQKHWRCIILKQTLPSILELTVCSSCYHEASVMFQNYESESSDVIIGHGETEYEAWMEAVKIWNDTKSRNRILQFSI